MKLLILNEDPIVGASWINPNYASCKLLSEYMVIPFNSWRLQLLTRMTNQQIVVNSGRKIRFQKPYQNLQIPKGLNEF